jgi:peptidoglycan/LPS O-acetylase OafA/YrhL
MWRRPWSRRGCAGCGEAFGSLAAVTVVAYLPLLFLFGPSHWFVLGPFAIQASRILLYTFYFCVGVATGPAIRVEGRGGVALAAALLALVLALQAGRLHLTSLIGPANWLILSGIVVALFCAATTCALLAIFTRVEHHFRIWDSLSASAYGIYLLHYPFVVWSQYVLLPSDIGAIPKATIVFTGSLALSWGCSAGVDPMQLGRWAPAGSIVGFRRG